MIKRHKDLLRAIVVELRRTLIGYYDQQGNWTRGDLDRELERLGVAPDGAITPIDVLLNASEHERRGHAIAAARLSQVVETERGAARAEIVERAAYSWTNRLLALRAMEARGLIDETLRQNPDYDGIPEALYLLRHQEPGRAAGPDGGWWTVIENACTAQSASLPGLFDLKDPSVALRPTTAALLACIAAVGGTPAGFGLDEADAAFADPDAIGWAYQFYQEEPKKQTYSKLSKGGKVGTRAEIAAATQLFTEPYMVHWLLENSLGRSYHEMFPDSKLPDTWEYYIKPDKLDEPAYMGLGSLTVLDPCVGSGHFLRVAFDMLVGMYHEQHPDMSATQIADQILTRHLHGIDIDPRAAQLAALSLYLRSGELVRDEHRQQRKTGTPIYKPSAMNIAATPTGLTTEALERHLTEHPEDRILMPLLGEVFSALEHADILGSLVNPSDYLSRAIATLTQPSTMRMDLDVDDKKLADAIHELAVQDPVRLRQILLDRIASNFAIEAHSLSDVNASLFGHEAGQGVQLLKLLDQRFSIVVTNPPYMGSGNMGSVLRDYINRFFPTGKQDLFAAFLLHCQQLCRPSGRVAMITMQSWMFLRSFAELRAIDALKLPAAQKGKRFTGILREASFEALAHLGSNAFEEISGEVVQSVMFTYRNQRPDVAHTLCAYRLVGFQSVEEKARALRAKDTSVFRVRQKRFMLLNDCPIIYWVSEELLSLFSLPHKIEDFYLVGEGLCTRDEARFIRYQWEMPQGIHRWHPYSKGRGYLKWVNAIAHVVDFDFLANRVHFSICQKYPYLNGNSSILIKDVEAYFREGLTYSDFARGSLGVRVLPKGAIFSDTGPGLVGKGSSENYVLAAYLNSRLASFLVRLLCSGLRVPYRYTKTLPFPDFDEERFAVLASVADACIRLSSSDFDDLSITGRQVPSIGSSTAIRLVVEGLLEHSIVDCFGLNSKSVDEYTSETGIPSGWLPLLPGYDNLSGLLEQLSIPLHASLHSAMSDFLTKNCIKVGSDDKVGQIKSKLRVLFENGPNRNGNDMSGIFEFAEGRDDADAASGLKLPVPSETFLEELSFSLKLNPLSVYQLLEELRDEGIRCKPEEQRMLEGRLSIIVARLLGHLWPKQIKAKELLPEWADADGIIPLIVGTDELTLADRVRARLRAEGGELEAQRTEALLTELTGMSIEEWVQKRFFKRHVQQFKSRPIAWHLASTPQPGGGRRRGAQRAPAFECMVYYHACATDVLARVRTLYVEPLLRAERSKAEEARRAGDETTAAIATERLHELEDFASRLRQVENEGFTCEESDKLREAEPLDRWCGDGFVAPPNREEFLHQEQAWHVDLNDGVRVNIAPLQLAGLLAADVLKIADARKAIEDRARWRADERRWVRQGKLPRCGWMDDNVPESVRWTELEPQRVEERMKLAKKRNAALRKTGERETAGLPMFENEDE